jgi:hypothetical protein
MSVGTFATGFPYNARLETSARGLDEPPCAGADAPAFSPSGGVYVADFYSGEIYVFYGKEQDAGQARVLPDAHFGPYDLRSLAFGRGGQLFATLFGPGGDGLQPQVVQLNPATGATEATIATRATGLIYCPGQPAVSPLTGDLFIAGYCAGGKFETGQVDEISGPGTPGTPLAVHPFTTVESAVGGLSFSRDGSLYAEVGWDGTSEVVEKLAGPGTVPFDPPVVVGTVPRGYSFGLAVAATGQGGRATALVVTDWRGDVYSLDIASRAARRTRLDARGDGEAGAGFSSGLGWGAARRGSCLYVAAGPSIVRTCGDLGFGGAAVSAGGGSKSPVSSISSSLPTPPAAFRPWTTDIVSAAVAVAAALLVTYPADIFNNTLQENYDDIAAWWLRWLAVLLPAARRELLGREWRRVGDAARGALGRAPRDVAQRRGRAGVGFVVVGVGAVLGSLLDPRFGLNQRTGLSVVAIAASLVAGPAVAGLVTYSYHRARQHGPVPYTLEALPVGLVVAVACVLVSRSTGFEPGYLYGVVAGVAFGRALAPRAEGHLAALSSLARVAVGLVAWAAWDGVHRFVVHSKPFFGAVLASDFLASIFVSALVCTVISLLPLRFLPGYKLKAWHKGAWAATFALSLFLLVQVLMQTHPGLAGKSNAPLLATGCLFIVFAGASLVFREHFVRPHRLPEPVGEAGHDEVGLAAGTPYQPAEVAGAGPDRDVGVTPRYGSGPIAAAAEVEHSG